MKVTQRVDTETGQVVYAPRLQGTLKVRNTSTDQAARLIGGEIEYMNAEDQPIALADGRDEPSFTFSWYSSDRLNPGGEVSKDIDVSFPAAAVDGARLAAIRLNLSYIPSPYREASARVPVSVAP